MAADLCFNIDIDNLWKTREPAEMIADPNEGDKTPRSFPATASVEIDGATGRRLPRWRNDGRCGPAFPIGDAPARCPTPEEMLSTKG